jgi:hypothetical protein
MRDTNRDSRALSRAAKDYRHAMAMLALAFSDSAKRRHARRAKVAEGRMREARRAIAMGACLLESGQ